MRQGRVVRAHFGTWHQLVPALAASKKLVCLDIFDTLVRRRVPPDAVKELVAMRFSSLLKKHANVGVSWRQLHQERLAIEGALCQANKAQGDDDEFRYDEMLARWVEPYFRDDAEKIVRMLAQEETAIERAAQAPTPNARALVTRLKKLQRRVVCVSDFYLDAATLRGFLAAANLDQWIDGVYASSTNMRRKASGRLYQHVLECEGVSPRDVLMVGDNPHADMARASEAGIDVVWLDDTKERVRKRTLDRVVALAQENPFFVGAAVETVNTTIPVSARPQRDRQWQLGRALAPAFTSFAERILEIARDERFDSIYFCSREGLLFLRMCRHLLQQYPQEFPASPLLRYIGVSRRSTMLASMDDLSPHDLGRLLHQYSAMSPKALMKNLNLEVREFAPFFSRHGFGELDEQVTDLLHDPRLQVLMQDEEVRDAFRAARNGARSLLLRYLDGKDFFARSRAMIVDIGWKGSIVDSIARATRVHPRCPTLEGVFFGTQPGTSQQPCPKRGVFVDARKNDGLELSLLANVGIFELYANAGHGSCVGYAESSHGVRPVLEPHAVEQEAHRTLVRRGQRAVFDYFKDHVACRPLTRRLLRSSHEECVPYQREQLRRLMSYPREPEIAAFAEQSHVESFGSVGVRHFRDELGFNTSVFDQDLSIGQKLYRAVRFSVWPSAILRANRLAPFMGLYDAIDTWHRSARW